MIRPLSARTRHCLRACAALSLLGIGIQSGTAGAVPDAAAVPSITAPAENSAVYFERRSVELTPDAMATIAQNAERLKSDGSASVTVVGYTDEVGSSSYGVALAQQRASAVVEALVGMGVDPRQVRATVHGQEAPGEPPCTDDACRKVEFRYARPQTADLKLGPAAHSARR